MASVSTAQPPSACGVHNLCAAAQTRQRHPACHALGERRDFGVDAIVLHCKKLACPAKAGLNLVGDQYNAVLVANFAQRPYERQRGLVEPTFALYWLNDYCRSRSEEHTSELKSLMRLQYA